MRTTVRIDDDLLRDLKRRAQKEKTSLTSVVNQAIRNGLKASETTIRAPRRFRQKTFSMGPPLVDLTKALALAAELEDEELIRRMDHGT
jgi:hypothetical protein